MEAFQNQDMIPEEWEKLADQVLTWGAQKTANEILTSRDRAAEENRPSTPPEFSDEPCREETDGSTLVRRGGRQTKNQGPSRHRDPIKYSVRLNCLEADITDLNKTALEAYRIKLATFQTDTDKPVEARFDLLERHFFRQNFDVCSWILPKHRMQPGAYYFRLKQQKKRERQRNKLKKNQNN